MLPNSITDAAIFIGLFSGALSIYESRTMNRWKDTLNERSDALHEKHNTLFALRDIPIVVGIVVIGLVLPIWIGFNYWETKYSIQWWIVEGLVFCWIFGCMGAFGFITYALWLLKKEGRKKDL
jgi:hypothetical protein